MLDPVIPLLAALCGALLFGWAASHKWRAPGEFAATLGEYRVLPQAVVPFAAPSIAFIETAVALALLWPQTRAWAGAAGVVVLLLYACAMAINLARGRRALDCGCGLVRRSISGSLVVRNLLLAAGLASTVLPLSARAMTPGDYGTVVAALAACALIYASAELLLARPAPRAFAATETP